MTQRIVIISGPKEGRRFELYDGQTLTVGRGEDSDTRIASDRHMSRLHCVISDLGNRVTLRDCGSSSGTFVDQTRIDECELRPGDVFRAGDTLLRYEVEGAEEPSTVVRSADDQIQQASGTWPGSELIGQRFGSFQLESVLARGRTGTVYAAHDAEANRKAALKVLSAEFAASDEGRQRFVRAMKTALDLQHPNLVCLYAAGKQGPHCWVAMELVEGKSIARILKDIGLARKIEWRHTWQIGEDIAKALHATHERGVIHRNLTPTNILRRTSDGQAKLGDWMLAKALDGDLAYEVTKSDRLLGELPYMAPERTHGERNADIRSDIYGLGATLYALLTGQPPVGGKSVPELLENTRNQAPIRPSKSHRTIPAAFEDIVIKMLAKSPEDRYQTPQELLDDLESYRLGKHVSS